MDNNIQNVNTNNDVKSKKNIKNFFVFIIVVLFIILSFCGGYILKDFRDNKNDEYNTDEKIDKNSENDSHEEVNTDEQKESITVDDVHIYYIYTDETFDSTYGQDTYTAVYATLNINGNKTEKLYVGNYKDGLTSLDDIKIDKDYIRIYNDGDHNFITVLINKYYENLHGNTYSTLNIFDTDGNTLNNFTFPSSDVAVNKEDYEYGFKFTDDSIYFFSQADNCSTPSGEYARMDENKISFVDGKVKVEKTGNQELFLQAGQGIC